MKTMILIFSLLISLSTLAGDPKIDPLVQAVLDRYEAGKSPTPEMLFDKKYDCDLIDPVGESSLIIEKIYNQVKFNEREPIIYVETYTNYSQLTRGLKVKSMYDTGKELIGKVDFAGTRYVVSMRADSYGKLILKQMIAKQFIDKSGQLTELFVCHEN